MTKKHFFNKNFLILAVFFAGLACQTSQKPALTEKTPQLHVLAGAGLIKPMEEIIESFEKELGAKMVPRYGGSGELMGQLAMKQRSDVFIPGAKKHVEEAEKKGWIAGGTARDIVKHIPVIAVSGGNPKQVSRLEDLARPGMSVALGDPDGCAIGNLAEAILKKNNLEEKVRPNVKVRTPTVNQLLLYVILGKVDASIIWEDMASWSQSRGELAVVRIPDEQNIVKTISAAVTAASENKELAEKLVDFLDSEAAELIWEKWGFEPCGS